MPRFAIVIGIDRYANADWKLDAAGEDAVKFARWALEEGGVEPDNLRLLLSTDTPPDDLPHAEADSANINDAILAFQNGAGAGGERLYFYYAGHGLSAPGASSGFAQEPVLIPADVEALPRDQGRCVGFSAIIPALNSVAPSEQFFFFDACRDFQLEDFRPGLGQAIGPWAPPRDPGAQSRQFVLYATAPGERAQEQAALKQGVFGEALLAGLRGAPAAAAWNSAGDVYDIPFSKLVRYVQSSVRKRIERAALKDHKRFMQVPEPLLIRATDAVLLTRTREQVGNVELTVRVAPSAARDACRLQLVFPTPAGAAMEIASEGPPVGTTAKLAVLPGDYALVAEAPKYEIARRACPVYATEVIDLPLKDAPDIVPAPESADCQDGRGRLEVSCPDPTALIVVDDAERALKGSGTCAVSVSDVEPGIYRIRLLPAEGRPTEEHAEVLAGAVTRLTLKPPEARLGSDQLEMLDAIDLAPSDDGYLRPAEEIDPIASARLGSLLGLAAFAAQAPGAAGLEKLRRIGLRSFADLAPGRAGLLVVIGASGDEPVPGVMRDQFLGESELIVRNLEGMAIGRGPLDVLEALPTAAQGVLELHPGCITVELRVPRLAPTRYALTALPDRVTVLVVVAEDNGTCDVQQYLVPALADALGPEDYLHDPRNIRRLEQAQRYYAKLPRLEPFDKQLELIEHELHVDDLLAGKWLDPLLGALAGYGLLRAGRADRYVGSQANGAGLEPSAMRNMIEHFGGLPDAHVLAALCEPERRDEHFARALELGLPVFAEGFLALYSWYADTRPATERPLWLEPSALLVGSPWTAWVVERPVLAVAGGAFEPAPLDWAVLEQERAAVERTLPAVGRLQYRDRGPVGTAFAIAPGLVLAMHFQLTHGSDGLEVCFADDPSSAPALAVEEVVAVLDRPGSASLVVLRTAARDGFPAPLALARQRPVPLEGRHVYAVGYPTWDQRAPEDLQARIFEDGAHRKRLQPGQLLGVEPDESVLRHDCLTLGGNAGSPLVDVESKLVVGVHYAGRWAELKRGDAVPLWPLAGHAQLQAATWS